MSSIKFIGCVLLVISCMIGGGILALPIVANQLGLLITFILMLFAYIVMLFSGFLIVDLSSKLPLYKNNFCSIAEDSFGKYARYIIMLSFAITLYSVLTAYINTSPDIFLNTILKGVSIPYQNKVLSLFFTIVFGTLVVLGVKYAEKLNSLVMIAKLTFLVVAVIFLNLNISSFANYDLKKIEHLSQGFSVIILVFSYQSIIPSLVNYIGKDNTKQLKLILTIATTITLVVSLLWINAIVSLVEPYGNKYHNQLTLGQILEIIDTYNFDGFITTFLKAFFNITLIASFIALSVAFIDYLIDSFKLKYTLLNRFYCGIIGFMPCWLVANFYENLFVKAIAISGFSGLFFALLLPSLASFKQYKSQRNHSPTQFYFKLLMVVLSVLVMMIIALGII